MKNLIPFRVQSDTDRPNLSFVLQGIRESFEALFVDLLIHDHEYHFELELVQRRRRMPSRRLRVMAGKKECKE